MKYSSLAVIPGLVSSQDDTSTLLSMNLRVQSTLESGVDQLLESVGSRNVTQMSSFLQNLVEEVITEDSGDSDINLDGDVKEALDMIKDVLLGQIRGALKEAHCQDQKDLHQQIMCFKGCEDAKASGAISCGDACDGSVHESCRAELLDSYVEHITACRTLDQFVHEFSSEKCPPEKKAGCHLPHTTWNCKAASCKINDWSNSLSTSLGTWIEDQIELFQNAYVTWNTLHQSCKQSYHNYISKDAECDCKQAECETRNCEWEKCHVVNCETTYNSCWMKCEKQHEETEKTKECLEKDRKIDWSATEKIECYVNVLLEKPDNATLLSTCGTDDCYNEYRKQMYHKCNDICVEVDYEGSWGEHDRRTKENGTHSGRHTQVKDQSSHRHGDIDVTQEGPEDGVRTRHRHTDSSKENRCTSHLDLDYQVPPCCQPCDPRPSPPCVGHRDDGDYSGGLDQDSYMWRFYGKHGFLSKDAVGKLDGDNLKDLALARCSLHADTVGLSNCGETLEAQKCHSGEHSKEYAYNLCDCVACTIPASPPQTCTAAKTCTSGYDYTKHHITGDCSETTAPVCPSNVGETKIIDDRCYFVHKGHTMTLAQGRDWCQQHGGALASIHTNEGNNAVLDLLESSSAWIGALRTDSAHAGQQGTWTWEDGSEWSDITWATDGLNHNGGTLHETRICIHSDRKWHDWTHGTTPKGVVCQTE